MNHSKTTSTPEFLSEMVTMAEQHLQQAISVYQNLSEAKLNRPSGSGGWSIAQCLEHLNSYGLYYLPKILNAVESYNGIPSDRVRRGWLGDYFIKMMDPDRQQKQYKAFKGHVPNADLAAYAVVRKFIDQQEQLICLLNKALVTDLNGIRIPISISKLVSLRLGDTFAFLIVHNERHVRQANNNLKLNPMPLS